MRVCVNPVSSATVHRSLRKEHRIVMLYLTWNEQAPKSVQSTASILFFAHRYLLFGLYKIIFFPELSFLCGT